MFVRSAPLLQRTLVLLCNDSFSLGKVLYSNAHSSCCTMTRSLLGTFYPGLNDAIMTLLHGSPLDYTFSFHRFFCAFTNQRYVLMIVFRDWCVVFRAVRWLTTYKSPIELVAEFADPKLPPTWYSYRLASVFSLPSFSVSASRRPSRGGGV